MATFEKGMQVMLKYVYVCVVSAAFVAVSSAGEDVDIASGLPAIELLAERSSGQAEQLAFVFIRNAGGCPVRLPRLVSEEGILASKSLKVYVQRECGRLEMPRPYGVSPLFLFANPGDGSSFYEPGGDYTLKPGEKKYLFRHVVDGHDDSMKLWFTLCIPDAGVAKTGATKGLILRSNTLTIQPTKKAVIPAQQ